MQNLTDKQKRIRIAEACGYIHVKFFAPDSESGEVTGIGHHPTKPHLLPDYLNNLNAMHEVEKVLTSHQYWMYVERLRVEVMENHVDFVADRASASARHRADAFLSVI